MKKASAKIWVGMKSVMDIIKLRNRLKSLASRKWLATQASEPLRLYLLTA